LDTHSNSITKTTHDTQKSTLYHILKKKSKDPDAIISFYIKSGITQASNLLKSLHLVILSESLVGVESLAENPYTMTYGSVPPEKRKATGI